ncbi:MAG: hypothetical protein R6V73_13465 [Anaerolineales bacterium]
MILSLHQIRLLRLFYTHLPGKHFRPAIGNALGHRLIASLQQPAQLVITPSPAIDTPNRMLALLMG